MKNFVSQLRKEIDPKIAQIESSETDIIKKSREASHVLGTAFLQLKAFILAYSFKDEAEEILFFREIKPRFCYRLIYYRRVYNIELSRPASGIDTLIAYLNKQQNEINKYTCKRMDFMHYYRSGATHLDALYFLRGQTDSEQYMDTFYYELDPNFSTSCDFCVTNILANDLLNTYLLHELELLTINVTCNRDTFPKIKQTWRGTKAQLIELIYAWDSLNIFENVTLKQLSDYIQTGFDIDLGDNLSRTFNEMKIRTSPTAFMDAMKEALLKRMNLSKR